MYRTHPTTNHWRDSLWCNCNKRRWSEAGHRCKRFWGGGGGRYERTYFDVSVFNPMAPSNRQQSLASTYKKHERIKIRAYEQRVREVEHGSSLYLSCHSLVAVGLLQIFATRGWLSLLAEKLDQPNSNTLLWMRCKLSFALLRSSIQCIRGARSNRGRASKQPVLPTDVVVAESNISP